MKSTVLVLMVITAAVFAQSESRTEQAPMDQQTVEAAPGEAQPVLASGGAATQTTTQEPQTCMGGGGIMSFIPMIAIIAIFYFLMIRPQQKQAKLLREMRDALQKDDRVITSGGIHGVITNLKGDVVTVRIAEGVKIDVDRNSLQLDSVEKEAAR
jgi:preprotein translocase subunit YajC